MYAVAKRDRRGFSLLELLVAVILMSVGFVALASLAIGTTGLLRRGAVTAAAQIAATGQMESLVATGCAGVDRGAVVDGKLRIEWDRTPAGPLDEVRVSVRLLAPLGGRIDSLRTSRACWN